MDPLSTRWNCGNDAQWSSPSIKKMRTRHYWMIIYGNRTALLKHNSTGSTLVDWEYGKFRCDDGSVDDQVNPTYCLRRQLRQSACFFYICAIPCLLYLVLHGEDRPCVSGTRTSAAFMMLVPPSTNDGTIRSTMMYTNARVGTWNHSMCP